jgi:hypothetical protein
MPSTNETITATVGAGAVNRPADVRVIQTLLRRHEAWLGPGPAPGVTGVCDQATLDAILAFQQNAAVLAKPDGVVTPGFFTLKRLNELEIRAPQHRIFNSANWTHAPGGVDAAELAEAARELGCDVAAIQAVAEVETKRVAWDEENRPTILFERHIFAKFTEGAYDSTHPDLSGSTAGGYGHYKDQYAKLGRSAMLDEEAALKSASWGRFQIMGMNHAAAGHATVADFVNAMMTSEARHLESFVAFVQASAPMNRALRAKDWATFARLYNGPDFKQNEYDTRMANAYAKFSTAQAAAAAG